jgi:hypothetical protein
VQHLQALRAHELPGLHSRFAPTAADDPETNMINAGIENTSAKTRT